MTRLFPGQFLVLAGAGNFTKALGSGMGKPAFRVIQQHFARNNNVGEVAAKEESWEVVGQLLGLLSSVALLSAVDSTVGARREVILIWAAIQTAHVVLRYVSLSSLRLDSVNLQRGKALVAAHVSGLPIPDVSTANATENFMPGMPAAGPIVHFGCSIEDAVNATEWEHRMPVLLQAFSQERYLLVWHLGKGRVLFKDDARPLDALRALWQCSWLAARGVHSASLEDIEDSLRNLQARFGSLLSAMRLAGWNADQVVIRMGPIRVKELDLTGSTR
eukprot:evm.model.scf_651.3 EVM.evm.TU.scf_651.3   scf_651:25587-30717(+)